MFLFFQPLEYVYCNCGTREKEDLQIECECTMDNSGRTRIPSAICHTKCRYRLCSGFKLSFSKIVIINGRSSTFYTDERLRLNQSVLVDKLVTTELITDQGPVFLLFCDHTSVSSAVCFSLLVVTDYLAEGILTGLDSTKRTI